jgi:uncharacterized protein YndB with AHSA1/START domain
VSVTRIQRTFKTSPHAVYRALTEASAIQKWRVPDGMRSEMHAFDAREGGAFRISLIYDDVDAQGKSSAHTDTYHGRFVTLVEDELVIETMEFETDDPAMQGVMTTTYEIEMAENGATLSATHEGVPPGVAPEDNEAGWRMSLDKLAALLEA